jgi:hypothetical protein
MPISRIPAVGINATGTPSSTTFFRGDNTWAAPASSITSGTAVASTSGTSIDFTSLPTGVKRITVMFSGVSTNGSSITQIQLGVSGTPETTGYLSIVANVQTTPNTTRGVTATTGFYLVHSGSSTNVINGAITFSNLNGNIWVCSGNIYESGTGVFDGLSGVKSLAGVLNMVRITTVNGTDVFDAGTINILYE